MPDIPKVKTVSLSQVMRDTITAGEAVKAGIATHAEKHKAAIQAKHHKLETDHKLNASLKANR